MKNIFILLQFLIFTSCSIAQGGVYSTTNKKAISFYEESMKAANSMNLKTGAPNYELALELLNKALLKDSFFWEAHVLSGEFYEMTGQTKKAIDSYKKTIAINPNHSTTGITYFYLADNQMIDGDFDGAIKNLEIFIKNRNANPDLVSKAYVLLEKSIFARDAMKNALDINPINMGKGINTSDPEYFPTITVDGMTILFTRELKSMISPEQKKIPNARGQEDFYVSSLSNNNIWGTAVAMPSNINTPLNEGAPTLAADGRSLIFVACSNQSNDADYGEGRTGKGSCDLFYTKKLGQTWSNPINLPGNVNSFSWETQPSLSADGKTLYFIRRVSKRGEPNNSDIFVVKLKESGYWGTPVRLSDVINTPLPEESVLIHPDGKTLYFASQGHKGLGGSDLYVTRMNEKGEWSKPENLGYPINTVSEENSLMVSPDGEIGFFASDRPGGFGDLDIYWFNMPENLRPTKTLYFKGKVFDVTNNQPLAGKFQLIDLKTGLEVIYSEADPINGQFMVSLPVDCEYALNVTFPGYKFFSQNFNMTNPEGLEAIHMDVPMIPLTSDITTVLENVFFDLDKATLRPESYVELNKLRDWLNANPTIKIELDGHTDTQGDAAENQVLSDNRAKAVLDYLITQGILATRLTSKGFGETVNKISDVEIAKLLTEKEKQAAHQKNRRTEYKIIK